MCVCVCSTLTLHGLFEMELEKLPYQQLLSKLANDINTTTTKIQSQIQAAFLNIIISIISL